MNGVFFKKYYVAILNDDDNFINKTINLLTKLYKNRIIIKTFKTPKSMFQAINISKIKNQPFDIAILNSDEIEEKIILNYSNPSLKVILCSDETSLKLEASKLLL